MVTAVARAEQIRIGPTAPSPMRTEIPSAGRRPVVDVDRHHGLPHRVADHFLPVPGRHEGRVQHRAHRAASRPLRCPGISPARDAIRPPPTASRIRSSGGADGVYGDRMVTFSVSGG